MKLESSSLQPVGVSKIHQKMNLKIIGISSYRYNSLKCHLEPGKRYNIDFCNMHQVFYEFLDDKSKLDSENNYRDFPESLN